MRRETEYENLGYGTKKVLVGVLAGGLLYHLVSELKENVSPNIQERDQVIEEVERELGYKNLEKGVQ